MSKDKKQKPESQKNSPIKWFSLGERFRKSKFSKIARKGLIVLAAGFAGFATLVFIFNISYGQRIFPKTYIGGVDVGSKSLDEARALIELAVAQNEKKVIILYFQNEEWQINTTDIDLKYDVQRSAELAWATGRQGGLAQIITEQVKSIFSKNSKPAAMVYDQEKLTNYLVGLANKVDVPEKDASILIENLIARLEPESMGRRLDIAQNSANILQIFGELTPVSRSALIVSVIQPRITALNAKTALKETNAILANNLTLLAGKKDFSLTPENLAGWLSFVSERPTKGVLGETTEQTNPQTLPEWVLAPQIDQEKVKAYVADLASQINQEARDAKFNMSGSRAVAFQTSQTGYELDQAQAVRIISEAILLHQTQIELPVKITEPDITASSAADMGIKEVVSEGTTHFYNSPSNRRHNIQIGAKALHGIIVKPGEEFSTIKNISPVDAEHGYLPELVIKENETKPEYGGGLCQVSTTLFRAALNAGLKITSRTNHSYRVSYYVPPIGMDATIYEPNPDFKFINNYDYPILIQSSVNDGESAIKFTIFGAKDTRKIEISNPVGYDYVEAGEPIYVEDPKLAEGEIKQVERAHGGAKAYFYYKVTRGSEVLQNETFRSNYVSWPARYLYGPGTEIPSPE